MGRRARVPALVDRAEAQPGRRAMDPWSWGAGPGLLRVHGMGVEDVGGSGAGGPGLVEPLGEGPSGPVCAPLDHVRWRGPYVAEVLPAASLAMEMHAGEGAVRQAAGRTRGRVGGGLEGVGLGAEGRAVVVSGHLELEEEHYVVEVLGELGDVLVQGAHLRTGQKVLFNHPHQPTCKPCPLHHNVDFAS